MKVSKKRRQDCLKQKKKIQKAVEQSKNPQEYAYLSSDYDEFIPNQNINDAKNIEQNFMHLKKYSEHYDKEFNQATQIGNSINKQKTLFDLITKNDKSPRPNFTERKASEDGKSFTKSV